MNHLTLLEFTRVVKKVLEKNLQPTYWIVAEIGELNVHAKGHCYLELVEKNNEQISARIKATIWSYTFQSLTHWFERITGQPLKPGMKILANAEVQFHESYGISLNIKDIDANFTLGERERVRQENIKRLTEENLIERNKKLELPLVPQRVAIISSEQSAGFGDFKNQLELAKNKYGFTTVLFPATMQGSEGTRSIVEALKAIFERIQDFDLVVILRGGGAQTDLDCFNTYLIGKAISRFPLPVVTGIGHDQDETIADIVAHTKLKTPTAVAEFLINGMKSFDGKIESYMDLILGNTQLQIQQARNELIKLVNTTYNQCHNILHDHFAELKLHKRQLSTQVMHFEKKATNKLDYLEKSLGRESSANLQFQNVKVSNLEKLVNLSDPEFTLKRGFTYSTINGKSIHRTKKVKLGDELVTLAFEKKITSTVDKVD
ncbi:MAG: exodeoxyribonuclease VII large subunit [Bacteroidetes bacterium]|nr:exodeoxyribonuclease VII large subunit [Bacteroidota bacterium]MDA1121600.1 exodeoxyribonuclease VII large subunit [Bacteroidota bacterium]